MGFDPLYTNLATMQHVRKTFYLYAYICVYHT